MLRTHHLWKHYLARGLALIWAGWWTFFGLACGVGEKMPVGGVLLHAALPGLIFLVSAAIAFRWETIGGVLLMVEGLIVLIAYPLMAHGRFPLAGVFFVLLTMALPPMVAGGLLLIGGRKH